MRRFDNTGLWEALKNYDKSPSASLTAGETLLGEFIEELYAYCRDESRIAERIRTLGYTRSELAAFMENDLSGSKKGIPLRKIIGKAIAAIDSEIHIVKMDLKYPDRFLEFPSDNPPLARWNGKTIELIEYMLPLQLSGKLLLPSGKVMEYADLIRYLEASYGITIPGAYDRKTEVLSRSKPTVFIEKMLDVLKDAVRKFYQ